MTEEKPTPARDAAEPPTDEHWMRRALALAAQARATASPNPMVGAVLVKDGEVIGEGFHRKAGEPHAEINALREAGDKARDATIYVTLEPCCHHGRTPPCTDSILNAGIGRVVAAMEDPFSENRGRGVQILRANGVKVEVGLLEAEARRLNEAYLKRIITGLPWVTLKAAVTLDGKVATRAGHSRWITGEAAREEAHRLRSQHDVTLVGIGTALADDPQLTVRVPGDHGQQWRAVLDSSGRLPEDSQIASSASDLFPVYHFVDKDASVETGNLRGIHRVGVARDEHGLRLESVLRHLAARGANSVLVEGGARVLSRFMAEGQADSLRLFIAPVIIGDDEAPTFVRGLSPETMAEALRLEGPEMETFGDDFLLRAYFAERKSFG